MDVRIYILNYELHSDSKFIMYFIHLMLWSRKKCYEMYAYKPCFFIHQLLLCRYIFFKYMRQHHHSGSAILRLFISPKLWWQHEEQNCSFQAKCIDINKAKLGWFLVIFKRTMGFKCLLESYRSSFQIFKIFSCAKQ